MDPILTSLITALPMVRVVIPFDVMIAVADTDRFLYYLPGDKMRHESPVGKSISRGDGLWDAIAEKKIISKIIAKEVWGFPFKNTSSKAFLNEVMGIGGYDLSKTGQIVDEV
jgi:hypothetical protein